MFVVGVRHGTNWQSYTCLPTFAEACEEAQAASLEYGKEIQVQKNGLVVRIYPNPETPK